MKARLLLLTIAIFGGLYVGTAHTATTGRWTARLHPNLSGVDQRLLRDLPTSPQRTQAEAAPALRVGEQYQVVEWGYTSQRNYQDPFNQVDLDVVFTNDSGQQWRVPAFWAGGNEWRVRFAPPMPGDYKYHAESTDKSNPDLNGHEGILRVKPYKGSNPRLMHGNLRVSANRRYLEYADGTPFFWLGDTWWEGFCKRISLDDFKTLAADRRAKGFDVVLITAGLYSDEPPFDARSENEGGMPWEPGFARINPAYFNAADQRIKALVDDGLTPAIVGSWGYYLPWMGIEKAKKHWRNLVARYGAYPVVWIISGEQTMPYYRSLHPQADSALQKAGWTEVARYVRSIDPYGHLITTHPSGWQSSRSEMTDASVVDFDLLQPGHKYWASASSIVGEVSADYSRTPTMPVMVGEAVYEGHQQTNWQDVQRFALWTTMLNGAAGYTYGAGGLWEMNGKTVAHGPSPSGNNYENTPWNVAMRLPGSTQDGIGKRLLMKYAWWKFVPHPEWVEPHGTAFLTPHTDWFDVDKRWKEENGNDLLPYAAGIPGKIRVIYIPPKVYSHKGPLLMQIEEGVTYHAAYYDPVNGQKYDLGALVRPALTPQANDKFAAKMDAGWSEVIGHPRVRSNALHTNGSTWLVRKDVHEADALVRVDASSNANAGLLLRFHDADDSIVAIYSAASKEIWIHDRRKGKYGLRLGTMSVGEIGATMHLIAEAHGSTASLTVTDGRHTYRTLPIVVANMSPGSVGIWSESLLCEDGSFSECHTAKHPEAGERASQNFSNFAAYGIGPVAADANSNLVIGDAWRAPNLPLSQDWVLVLKHERNASPEK